LFIKVPEARGAAHAFKPMYAVETAAPTGISAHRAFSVPSPRRID
jgi:hypothetical protein